MKLIRRIDFRFAVKTVLFISFIITLFHVLVLAEVISYKVVWGGRLENLEQMRLFELCSIAINLLIISMVAMKGGYIKSVLPEKVLRVILWAFVVLFSLNTVGNLLSTNALETIIFTPLTLLLAILFLRMTMEGTLIQPPTTNNEASMALTREQD